VLGLFLVVVSVGAWLMSDDSRAVVILDGPPVPGARVTSPFGMRVHPITRQTHRHNGTDFGGVPEGTAVLAVVGGVVRRIDGGRWVGEAEAQAVLGERADQYRHRDDPGRYWLGSGKGQANGHAVHLVGTDGRWWAYLHLQGPPPVQVGQRIEVGDVLGQVGQTGRSTGPHLHLSVFESGQAVDPWPLIRSHTTRDPGPVLG